MSDVPQALSRLFGQYATNTASGRYVLILDGKGAELRFTDKQERESAYRGHYTVDGASLEVDWNEQRSGRKWISMQTVADKMHIESSSTITAAEATFNRICK